MRLAIAVLLSIFAIQTIACEVAPREAYTLADDLINRTETIALATVVKAEIVGSDKRSVEYSFEVVNTLKGNLPEHFQLIGWPAAGENANHRFNEHADGEFRSNLGGRSIISPDCQIHPTFVVGGTYLVFLEEPYHVKSFEIIQYYGGSVSKRDKWLNYVQSKVTL